MNNGQALLNNGQALLSTRQALFCNGLALFSPGTVLESVWSAQVHSPGDFKHPVSQKKSSRVKLLLVVLLNDPIYSELDLEVSIFYLSFL